MIIKFKFLNLNFFIRDLIERRTCFSSVKMRISIMRAKLFETSRNFMSKNPFIINQPAYIRVERDISSFYCVCREIYESAECVRSFNKSLLPIYAGVHVSIHFAYTYARPSDFRMRFPLFSSLSLFYRRIARIQRPLFFSSTSSLSRPLFLSFFSVCTCESRFNNSLR